MAKRRIYDDELHAQFVTFSCFHRRRLLDHDRAKKIVISHLASELHRTSATCCGFVVMPDHVHAIVWFPETGCLSDFMKQWKQRSSRQIKTLFRDHLHGYADQIDLFDVSIETGGEMSAAGKNPTGLAPVVDWFGN